MSDAAAKDLHLAAELWSDGHEKLIEARASGDRLRIIETENTESHRHYALLEAALQFSQRAGRGEGAATA